MKKPCFIFRCNTAIENYIKVHHITEMDIYYFKMYTLFIIIIGFLTSLACPSQEISVVHYILASLIFAVAWGVGIIFLVDLVTWLSDQYDQFCVWWSKNIQYAQLWHAHQQKRLSK